MTGVVPERLLPTQLWTSGSRRDGRVLQALTSTVSSSCLISIPNQYSIADRRCRGTHSSARLASLRSDKADSLIPEVGDIEVATAIQGNA